MPGSSPRLRGTLHVQAEQFRVRGIIPALAGNTARRSTPRPAGRDHPRACGEHTKKSLYFQLSSSGRKPFSFTFLASSSTSSFLSDFLISRESPLWNPSPYHPLDFPPYRRARLYFAALLQPCRGAPAKDSKAASSSLGCRINCSPSQSTGCQSDLNTRKSRCCSLRAEKTMMALPSFNVSTMRSHNLSRTRALTCPTNTPGAISNNQRLTSPRNPVGQAVNTMTTIVHFPHSSSSSSSTMPYALPAATSFTFSSHNPT